MSIVEKEAQHESITSNQSINAVINDHVEIQLKSVIPKVDTTKVIPSITPKENKNEVSIKPKVTIFSTLTLLRAISSIAVVDYHYYDLSFIKFKPYFPFGFLAVDFFFMLSGFLVSSSNFRSNDYFLIEITEQIIMYPFHMIWTFIVFLYNKLKLYTPQSNNILIQNKYKSNKQLTPKGNTNIANIFNPITFMLHRFIRLFPMQLFGTCLLSATFLTANHNISDQDFKHLFLLGTFSYPNKENQLFFPINPLQWTMIYEYASSLLYALLFRHLNFFVLLFLNYKAGHILYDFSIGIHHYGYCKRLRQKPTGIGYGSYHDECSTYVGTLRMLYGFLTGMVIEIALRKISQLYYKYYNKKLEMPFGSFISILIIIAVYGGWNYFGYSSPEFQTISLFVLLPICLICGALCDLKLDWVKKVAQLLGDNSYPLFLTHWNFCLLFKEWTNKNKMADKWVFNYHLRLKFIETMLFSIGVLKCYDVHFRKLLNYIFFGWKIPKNKICKIVVSKIKIFKSFKIHNN
ncbi:hypothetical protein EIN_423660 [Entamoeba invadens IP1]|uniref:Acyltransferase 3 domain-containing protein n=1 Tax=Entamoeba invadens IP1 TaxID=370355 RepID=A0A0A1UFZ3_ENTIV|nr:hypothetical protein EIN_423660 [Entamoeba invadens IP1]ELP94295.1 hypothetical protein EIN_423660 [Entamoeba invadens IP1]|eukprot:XP_004261066.1 hypothetical protein EIN_423660 [Entamoeba invadens IP1]